MRIHINLWIGIIAGCLCSNVQADWVNALKPEGKAAGAVKVVKAGKPQGGIQLPNKKAQPATLGLQESLRPLNSDERDTTKPGPARQSQPAPRWKVPARPSHQPRCRSATHP